MNHRNTGYKVPEAVASYIKERLHFGWRLRGERAVRYAEIKKGDFVLDLCSGPGMVAKVICETVGKNGKVVGIDISNHFVKYARNFCRKDNVSFIAGDIENLNRYIEKDIKFDACLILASWLWIQNKKKVCKQIRRHLKPDGRFVISLASDDLEEPKTKEFYWKYRENLKASILKRLPDTDLDYINKLPVIDGTYIEKVVSEITSCGYRLKSLNKPGRSFKLKDKLRWYDTHARTEWVGDFTPEKRLEIIKEAYLLTAKETNLKEVRRCTYYLTFTPDKL